MDPSIFRQYDIRGLVGDNFNEKSVGLIARAYGSIMKRRGHRRFAVGRDVRLTSAPFAAALTEGLLSCGLDVIDLGVVPTPFVYYAILQEKLDGGVMVTGSHNPIDYNGLKLCEGKLALWGEQIQEIRKVAEAEDFESATGEGSASTLDIFPKYRDDLLGRFDFGARRKIVVDCGNGVGGPVIPGLLREAGHEVIELYTEPDGTFPNHLPDPEVPEYMKDLVAKVKSEGADIGLGYDGDADRLGIIDENGRKISADWLVTVFARDLLTRHPGGIVRYDIKCSDFLEDEIRAAGGKPVMGQTGHSILKKDMAALDAILGGELSGHIVFGREWYPIDDPFFCAFELLRLMETKGCRVSGLFEGIPETFSTAEIKVAVPEDRKFVIVEELVKSFTADFQVNDVDGARVRMKEGWGLVRASNTTANLTIRFESLTQAGLESIRAVFLKRLEPYSELDLSRVREAF
ncbi:MAG: phosphomannomutase/phosphoglucomutase [Planctomycetota bacterium]